MFSRVLFPALIEGAGKQNAVEMVRRYAGLVVLRPALCWPGWARTEVGKDAFARITDAPLNVRARINL